MIAHDPKLNVKDLVAAYNKQYPDLGIHYICTTDIEGDDDVPRDIFWCMHGVHPNTGTAYFAVWADAVFDMEYTTGCDYVEDYEFAMVKDSEGNWHYSRSLHEKLEFANGNAIEGGRKYTRYSSGTKLRICKLKDGVFYET